MQDVQAGLDRANILLHQHRVKDAQEQLHNILQQEPQNSEALALLTRCSYQLNQYDEGLDIVEQAIQSDPENPYLFYLRGFGYYHTDKLEKAIQNYESALMLQPYFSEVYAMLAYVYIEKKDFKRSLAYANDGLAWEPENLSCLNARSISLNKLKMTDEAIATMKHALAQDPDNEHTHTTVGWNFLEKGKHKEANKHFKEALRINPNYSSAQLGLKESLKSNIPPYRWLLQYSFWVNNKGKNMRWIIPVGLYVLTRLGSSLFQHTENYKNVAYVIVGLYLLFVITSWVIGPLANFFLLFHKDGKYALTPSEKYSSISVVTALCAGMISLIILALLPATQNNLINIFTLCTLVFWGLSMPLSSIHFPLSFKNYGRHNKFSMMIAGLGILSILFTPISFTVATAMAAAFLIMLIINSWTSLFKK